MAEGGENAGWQNEKEGKVPKTNLHNAFSSINGEANSRLKLGGRTDDQLIPVRPCRLLRSGQDGRRLPMRDKGHDTSIVRGMSGEDARLRRDGRDYEFRGGLRCSVKWGTESRGGDPLNQVWRWRRGRKGRLDLAFLGHVR